MEEMISLEEFFARLAGEDRRWTRWQLVEQLERLAYRLSEAVKGLRFPSDDDLYLAMGERAVRDLEILFRVLRQIKDGVPLQEIRVPATFLTEPVREEPSSPYVITQEIGTPLETLGLSPRVANLINRSSRLFDRPFVPGRSTVLVEDIVRDCEERGGDGLLAIKNFGQKALEEVLTALREKGFLE